MHRTLLVVLALLLLFPAHALARPLTTPSAANIADLHWYFEQAAVKYAAETTLFRDIDVRDPAYGAAAQLSELGVLQGFEDGTLRTWAPVSRAEVLKILVAALHAETYRPPYSGTTPFPDVAQDHWAVPFLLFAADQDIIHGYEDGTFRPDAPVSRNELRTMLDEPLLGQREGGMLATRGEVLQRVVANLPLPLPTFELTGPPTITVEGRDVLLNGTPVRGLMANWQIRERFGSFSKEAIGKELDRMRSMGFIGVSTEIGWEDMEPSEGRFDTPQVMDDLFDAAQERGMLVSLLLAPHYTPRWVFSKHGDVLLKDRAGNSVIMGEYMTFSPSSPAAEHQIAWQKRAAEHYARHPNLLALYLSNEQSYGNKHNVDYSLWADQRWQQWRSLRGMPPAPMPRSESDPERLAWQRFRQDNLNEFLNRSYETVAAALPRPVPVSHKVIFYEATSAYAPQYGLHPTPGRLSWDIVGADIYGLTPNVYPAQLAHEKPIHVVETNLPGNWPAESMREYLVYQALKGISVQTIYRWNPCEDENCLFHLDGTLWDKAKRIPDAARTIAALPRTLPDAAPSVAVLVPTNAVQLQGDQFWRYQHRFDELVSRFESTPGVELSLLWSDDLLALPNDHILSSPEALLKGIKTLYAILPASDRDDTDGRVLLTWVGMGGTLLIDAAQAANLPWIGRTSPGTSFRGSGQITVCDGSC